MNPKRIAAVFRKELRELLRDRKTVLLMILLPLVIYPLLVIGVSTVAMRVQTGYETANYRIVTAPGTDPALTEFLTEVPENADYRFSVSTDGDPEAVLAAGDADAALLAEPGTMRIVYRSADKNSGYAADYLADRLADWRTHVTETLLTEAGMAPDEILRPFRIERTDTASGEESIGSVLGMIMPLLLIMGVFLGTMNPAVDLTAGEKERGTQETMMTFPLTGRELICGKYLAVSVYGACSALLYLLSVGILGFYLYGMTGAYTEISLRASAFLAPVAVTVVTVLAFALFLGAAIMCLCAFAKSTKEASGTLSPLMIIIMLISYAGYLDVRLTHGLSIVPVLNIVLLIKSVLLFDYDGLSILLVLVSNIAYAAIAIAVLGRLYTSERVLFGEREGSLTERHTKRVRGSVPTPGDAILVLAVTAVLYLYAGTILQLRFGLPGTGMTQLLILLPAVAAVLYGRKDPRAVFSLKKPKPAALASVLVLAPGAFLLGNGLMQPLSGLAKESAGTYTETLSRLLDGQSLPFLLLVLALAPAICEEGLFRGYLFSAFRSKTKLLMSAFLTALLFGVYHLNLVQGTYAFLLGLLLAWVTEKTGSILCSSLLHFLCNAFSVLISVLPESAAESVPFLFGEKGMLNSLAGFLIPGALLTAAGIRLLSCAVRGKLDNDSASK